MGSGAAAVRWFELTSISIGGHAEYTFTDALPQETTMRIAPFIALNLVCLMGSTGLATDVIYKLDEKIFARPEPSISIQPGELKIIDRAWAAPGVEQTSKDLLPPVRFDFTGAPRL